MTTNKLTLENLHRYNKKYESNLKNLGYNQIPSGVENISYSKSDTYSDSISDSKIDDKANRAWYKKNAGKLIFGVGALLIVPICLLSLTNPLFFILLIVPVIMVTVSVTAFLRNADKQAHNIKGYENLNVFERCNKLGYDYTGTGIFVPFKDRNKKYGIKYKNQKVKENNKVSKIKSYKISKGIKKSQNEKNQKIEERNEVYKIKSEDTAIKTANTFEGLLKKMNLKRGQILGQGSYGEVCEYQLNNKRFAVKQNTRDCEKIEKIKGKILKGNSLSLEYKHENVLKSRSIIVYREKEKKFFNIEKIKDIKNGDIIKGQVMDVHGTRLLDKATNGETKNKRDIKLFGRQIASGIKYLHDNGQVHGDIKLDNVLIKNNKIKINDYDGIIKYNEIDKNKKKSMIGSPSYISPEVLYHKEFIPANDCWAFGIMLFGMAFRFYPFLLKNNAQKNNAQKNNAHIIKHREFGFKGHESFEKYAKKSYGIELLKMNPELSRDKEFWNLMNRLICHKDSRLSMKDVLDHPFFKQ